MKKHQNYSVIAAKKVRGDWGSISPITKVIQDKRRKKKEKQIKKEMAE